MLSPATRPPATSSARSPTRFRPNNDPPHWQGRVKDEYLRRQQCGRDPVLVAWLGRTLYSSLPFLEIFFWYFGLKVDLLQSPCMSDTAVVRSPSAGSGCRRWILSQTPRLWTGFHEALDET
ncbi:hypothetical protein CTA2_1504 [Colletotrichum tanaceti]|nr:hypothetical protein CTA2_1504 [Colletotrichum tanaceti]